MRFSRIGAGRLAAFAAGIFVFSLAVDTDARADDKTYMMKITLPTLNDAPHVLAKNFAAAVERDSGGRIKPEVYPASQLGSIPRQIEGTQFGAIQVCINPPEFFVGVDERFEVMTAPGMVDSMAHGQRLAGDPEVLKVMLALGADKGLHGVGMFIAEPNTLVMKTKLSRLADFQGKKIRIFASDFQASAFKKLGATPVAMTLGDVMPALQQGAIDGAIAGLPVFTAFHYQDAAKYITETNMSSIFLVIEVSKKWYELATFGFAADHRQGWRGRGRGNQSDCHRSPQQIGSSLDRGRRRVEQSAAGRSGADDQNDFSGCRRGVEDKACTSRRL